LVVRVGNVVSQLRLFAGDITYSSHGSAPEFGKGAILHYFQRLPNPHRILCPQKINGLNLQERPG
ncbi:MAG TPA: hypothetical protein VN792_04105, partial [Candidatus Acidoferrales bacterium]|nr:hypothetical protein [Candidatus Acidoferrales bacterium]